MYVPYMCREFQMLKVLCLSSFTMEPHNVCCARHEPRHHTRIQPLPREKHAYIPLTVPIPAGCAFGEQQQRVRDVFTSSVHSFCCARLFQCTRQASPLAVVPVRSTPSQHHCNCCGQVTTCLARLVAHCCRVGRQRRGSQHRESTVTLLLTCPHPAGFADGRPHYKHRQMALNLPTAKPHRKCHP